MTIADLEARAQALSEAKREITAQLRAVEADLCEVMIAIEGKRQRLSARPN